MNTEDFKDLAAGDIVQGRLSNNTYIVTGNYGGRVTAVAQVDLTHPDEWELVSKVTQRADLRTNEES